MRHCARTSWRRSLVHPRLPLWEADNRHVPGGPAAERCGAVQVCMTLTACFRHTLRRFARRPGVAPAAILILASGIGVTTALFSITNAALLQPLPWPHADRLVHIHAVLPERRHAPANLKT